MQVTSGVDDGNVSKNEDQESVMEENDYIIGFKHVLLLSALTSAALLVLIDNSIVAPVSLLQYWRLLSNSHVHLN